MTPLNLLAWAGAIAVVAVLAILLVALGMGVVQHMKDPNRHD